MTILVALLVRIDEPDLKLLKGADYPGIVLMAIALGTLEYVLEEGSRWNWFDDATIRTCAGSPAIAGILFVIRSLTFARPVVDLRACATAISRSAAFSRSSPASASSRRST